MIQLVAAKIKNEGPKVACDDMHFDSTAVRFSMLEVYKEDPSIIPSQDITRGDVAMFESACVQARNQGVYLMARIISSVT